MVGSTREIVDSMTDKKGFLTRTDRNYLRGGKEYDSKQGRYDRRQSIRERTRGALRDFRLLVKQLPDEERDKIFAAEPGDKELTDDVGKAIQFLYTGMGGESGFRRPFRNGVASGEVALGNVENALYADPQFRVEQAYRTDRRAVVDLVEVGEWERLSPPDLFTFIRLALDADALDFEAIRDRVDFAEWSAEYYLGKKHREIPGGKSTPSMEPEVYEEEGIGEMSAEELRDLFGDGYPPSHIYDGEKVVLPPPPGSDEDPEVVDWIGDAPEDVDEEWNVG
jgi:hypothetical protein